MSGSMNCSYHWFSGRPDGFASSRNCMMIWHLPVQLWFLISEVEVAPVDWPLVGVGPAAGAGSPAQPKPQPCPARHTVFPLGSVRVSGLPSTYA